MALTLQDVIMKLHTFWAEQGCVIWQPYNIQLGAGTGNPATFLRVLGPEPWRVAYLEPSIRPDDGRYGENPNRMQAFYQYQVILKPDPGNPQELYLKSLEALGINPREHDLRFVEDNWESPALGAWGLGWEVWLDGQEITQFTYFQQSGGLTLDQVSVEITYGIERIVLALQGVDAVWDIEFTNGISYGNIFLQSEIEHCTYYFEVGDVEGLRQTYDVYEQEHQRALERGLVVPAYDYVLKCSHLFNVLDTRGAIGVTERAQFFRRMRNMSLNVAKAYAEQRENLGHPMLNGAHAYVAPALPDNPASTETADFLLEIGTEELPSGDVDHALAQLREITPAWLDDLRLGYEAVEIYATPRRLVVAVRSLAPTQPDVTEEVKGPPAKIAFDDAGKLTKAAEGFARKQGIEAAQLERKEIDGGEYVVATVEHQGQPTTHVLAEALPDFVAKLSFGKSMRWNTSGIAFSRPIRWFVALFGNQTIPFSYAHVVSGNTTRGVRPLGSPEIRLQDVASYFNAMEDQGIILDYDQRRAVIQAQAATLAEEVSGNIPDDPDLLDEITNLVERPTALRGNFDERFLELPREVLVTVMRDKQRYFAVQDAAGKLLPHFITVRNGDEEHLNLVQHGNEHVLVARYKDAEFFYNADIRQPLADYLPRLDTLTFQVELGSMLAKNERVAGMVEDFGHLIGANEQTIATAKRAGHLAKADLATQVVVEFTSLQGTMGRIYAELGGEEPAVAAAIFEHWLPRGAGDRLPVHQAGILLALLDRLDSLVGLFAVGLAPTGGADPFAMRRSAVGVLQILIGDDLTLDLRAAIASVAHAQPVAVSDEHQAGVLEFINGRFRVMLLEQGEPHDVVEAVLAEQAHNPAEAVHGIHELTEWVKRDDWEPILDAFARCVRITRNLEEVYTIRPDDFQEPAEKDLYAAYQAMQTAEGNIGAFLSAFEPQVPVVSAFFDGVMVMDDDQAVRENRLGLLQAIAALTHNRADLSHLSGF